MIKLFVCGKPLCLRKAVSFVCLLACFSTAVLAANDITGSVRNQTRGLPAVDDEVILIRLDGAMREEARAKTDAQGTFAVHVQYPGKAYLLRVVHQGVTYDHKAAPGDALSVQVFDAASQVPGVTGSIEILRAGTTGTLLHVSDMYEIRNNSNPPITQAGERTFDVYLPSNAKIDSVLASGPAATGSIISASAVPGDPGHYTVNFPLRPGANKFAFNYDLPYDGHATFQTRRAYPVQQLAVMIPPAMKFASRSPAFAPLATGNNKYQVQVANQLSAGKGPAFQISGSGALPLLGDQGKSQPRSPSFYHPTLPASAADAAALLSPVQSPVLTPLPSVPSPRKPPQTSGQSFVLGGLSGVLLATCAFLIWRVRKPRTLLAPKSVAPQAHPRQTNATSSEALREELSRLEADKLRGSISANEYASTKQALEKTRQRAIGKPV